MHALGAAPRLALLWLALLLGAGAGSALSQAQSSATSPAATPPAGALLPAALFFSRPQMEEVALSPSGRRLALSMPGANGRVGLFVVDLQSPTLTASRAAYFDDIDVDDFAWVDDERLVFGLVDRTQPAGELQRQGRGLVSTRHDGSAQRQLIERFGRPLVTGGERLSALSVEHGLLHVPLAAEGAQRQEADDSQAPRLGEVVVGQWVGQRGELAEVRPLLQDIRSGRTRQFDLRGMPEGAIGWWFSPRGEPRLVLARANGRDALHWREPAAAGQSARWRQLAEAPMHQLPFTPLWVGQGERLYVRWPQGPAREEVVAPFDFTRGVPAAPLVLTPGFDFRGNLLDDRAGNGLLGVRVHTDAETTVWFDPAHKALQDLADAALPGRVNRIVCRRCAGPDAVMLVRSYADRQPDELYLWRAGGAAGGAGTAAGTPAGNPASTHQAASGHWLRVGAARPGLDAGRMARVDFHRIRARDGRDLPLWVTQPAGMRAVGDARAAVVLVHGGPWVRHGHWRWEPMAQFLASRGWLVIEPEFRGSAGYGQAHLEAGFRQWGQAMQDDVADALLWARAKGLADGRACIAGGSYGGYSTLMGLVRHPELYRCGAAWMAVTDLLLLLEGSWWVRDDIAESGRRFSLPLWVGDPAKDREMLLANSPLAQAARIRAPLLLLWGSEDLRVPIEHGERLRKALQAAGREPGWVVYRNEAHGLARSDNRIDMALQLERFLRSHLQPAPADVPADVPADAPADVPARARP
jgi:dienelactone hydrolase